MVPVLAATGGSARSSTAALLACGLAERGETVLVDLARRWVSPWPMWVDAATSEPGGIADVPPSQPVTTRQVRDAAVTVQAGPAPWQVLTDRQAWQAPPLDVPEDAAAWHQLVAVGGWQCAVVDTHWAVGEDLALAAHRAGPSVTQRWTGLPCVVPVWCATATGPGVDRLMAALAAAEEAGLPVQDSVVALTHTADGRLPAPVRAACALLADRVARLVEVPFLPRLRSHGPLPTEELGKKGAAAAEDISSAVLGTARDRYGSPLPNAAIPDPV
ncbi:hypothetical protein ACOJQ7_14835 [Streptomyces bohaiensis]